MAASMSSTSISHDWFKLHALQEYLESSQFLERDNQSRRKAWLLSSNDERPARIRLFSCELFMLVDDGYMPLSSSHSLGWHANCSSLPPHALGAIPVGPCRRIHTLNEDGRMVWFQTDCSWHKHPRDSTNTFTLLSDIPWGSLLLSDDWYVWFLLSLSVLLVCEAFEATRQKNQNRNTEFRRSA